MSELRVLAVDDEVLALRRIKRALADIEEVELVGEADGCRTAIDLVRKLKPDVMLLDIRMRDGTGFDLVESLAEDELPVVIFVSAFDHYAVRAFETNAADYVLKPLETDRLRAALSRARFRLDAESAHERMAELQAVITSLRDGLQGAEEGPRYETELWIRKSLGGYVRVAIDNIDWVSSEEDYVRIYTEGGSFLLRGSIRTFEQRVDPGKFTRIHRRTLVRTAAIREVRSPRLGGLEIVLAGGEHLKAGRVYARRVRSLFNGGRAD
ncbi:LytTR family DNA-binding domain-containing protein [Sphingosinicella sp. LHD-64]|uniref:LytR/AlgR family response regulator transcription factor n=1 Tax=Sphingosinicella sp. LHD-64 TaxID=3072139 RepID=UPI00280DBB98|nr:LytTR family DNA-binding domain-containing protein [Sphingosinicella sp. LHD-64]MDQ8757530.1 LytTR family DNA-binding domain-containing protein [Sphingosinicella sp. LHD-64]